MSRPGYHSDGAGLYLQVSSSLSKSWIFRFTLAGRSREMGLGPFPDVSLARAREQAKTMRELRRQGIDPIEHQRTIRSQNLGAAQKRRTFEWCAQERHKLLAPRWKNKKHGDQWINTLTAYAFPVFGSTDVALVAAADILRVLEPIWITKRDTASRVKQRIRDVLDWAHAQDYRIEHDSSKLWTRVDSSLPQDKKKQSNFKAAAFADVPSILEKVRASRAGESVKAAFEFLVLTAARSGEARGAKWSEVDFQAAIWTIPAERMKAGIEHHVPLSARAVEILKSAIAFEGKEDVIFPGRKGNALSDMALTVMLRRLDYDITVHGFRSSFRDWAGERTNFPARFAEFALAHQLEDETEAAYARSKLTERRRPMMQQWADFCSGQSMRAKRKTAIVAQANLGTRS